MSTETITIPQEAAAEEERTEKEAMRKLGINKRIVFMFEKRFLADCSFSFPNGDIEKYHTVILAVSSPRFQTMLEGQDLSIPIIITDVDQTYFNLMMQFIYCDKVDITIENATKLCSAAIKYQILSLVGQCIAFIKAHLSTSKFYSILELAMETNDASLMKQTLKFLQAHTKDIIENESLLQAKSATIVKIVEQDLLNITNEIEVFDFCYRWGEHHKNENNIESMREVFNPMLPHIRFLNMKPDDFVNKVATTNILTKEEQLDILKSIAIKDPNLMPENFCANYNSRIKLDDTERLENKS